MRFELGISELADLTPAQAKVKLAELPKGISTGVIIKALQEGYIPSVTIAWSEDKRVINEIEDRLTEIGFTCYVVDRGFFVLRLITLIGEKLGRSRYRKVEKEDRSYISLGEGKRRGSFGQSDVAKYVLMYALQLLVVEGLYIWRVGLKIGAVNLASAKNVGPQLGACAAGFLAAYVLTTTIQAYRAGKLSAPLATPLVLLSVGCTIGALFFMKIEHDVERESRAIGQPTSNPFAGLLVELRKRGAGEAGGEAMKGDIYPVYAAAHDGFGEDSLTGECFDPADWGHAPACFADLNWDMTQTCLPMPPSFKRPPMVPAKIVKMKPPQAKRVRKRGVRPWGVTFELVDLSKLLLLWMISLGGMYLFLKRKGKLAQASTPTDATQADSSAPEQPMVAEEVQALQAQLTEARARLNAMQAAGQSAGDGNAIHALQTQLAETQASLAAHQNVIATFRQQLGPIKEMHAEQTAEIDRLRAMLLAAQRQAAAQQAAVGAVPRVQAAANTQGRPRRVDPRAEEDEPEEPSRTHHRRP